VVQVKIVNVMNPSEEPWPEQTTLMFEVAGSSEVAVREQLNTVVDIGKSHGGYEGRLATNKEETKSLWLIRKQCIWSAMSMYPDREPMITDACVPLSKLPDIIRWTREKIDASTLPSPIIAHAGDGNFHVCIMLRPDVKEDVAEAHALAAAIATKAISLGGTCTGEHGIGVGKKKYLLTEMGPGSISLMKKIKAMIDDRDIMNPGKVFDK
jgi:D-lactate dehydrogenase (cytochrome)